LKQQEAITSITDIQNSEKQLQTRQALEATQSPPLIGNPTKECTKSLIVQARSLLAELHHATTLEPQPASSPGAFLLYAVGL
jgi:hypothetical protein